MLRLDYATYDEIRDIYPFMFEDVFGHRDVFHVPGYVLIVYINDEYAGFLSCYNHDPATIYIQYCGYNEKYRNSFSIKHFKEIINELHTRFHFILGRICNENIKALQVALFAGFKVIGARQATDGKLYLEIMRVRGG